MPMLGRDIGKCGEAGCVCVCGETNILLMVV